MRQIPRAISASLMLAACSAAANAQTAPILRMGLITNGTSSDSIAKSIERGVRLGAAEAKQTATLFGGDVLLFEETAGRNAELAADRLLATRKIKVLVGSSLRDVDVLSRFAESHHVVFFNAASRSSSLRGACRSYTFHIEASDSMYARAAGGGGSTRTAPNPPTLLWAPTLERYGASQINNRFRAKYQAPMDGGAWAGWVAAKIASEAALRARSNSPAAIRSYLESPTTSFDGHKGWPLGFRATDHQLRQPLYVAARGSHVGVRDVPELSSIAGGSSAGVSASQTLDTLMPNSAPRCAWH